MWFSHQWTDYELIDASNKERLERWGSYTLIRPDPSVIWNTPRNSRWDNPNAIYHRSKTGGGSWEFFSLPREWEITYKGENLSLYFMLKPFSFKHTGLFPEQAANWDWISKLILKRREEGKSVKLLNLFAYTGGATLAAAASGAEVTHVDSSRGMVSWARENAALSGLSQAPIRWLTDDCIKFLERELRRGNHYDAIIMDPPSYGRGPKGEVWRMEDGIYDLLNLCRSVLSDHPLFVLINSYNSGLPPASLSYLLNTVFVPSKGGTVEANELGIPVTATNLLLPCGAAGRWIA